MVIGKYRITQRGYVVFGATGILLLLLIGMQVKAMLNPMSDVGNDGKAAQIQQSNVATGSESNPSEVVNGNTSETGSTDSSGQGAGTSQGSATETLSAEEKNRIMKTAQCTIYFKPDAYDLEDAFYGELNDIVEMSKRFKDSKIVIDGHFNGVPGQKTTEFRVSLAQNRAEMVEAYLISQGVDSDRIMINNLGCSVPVNKDDSWQEIEKNRRVEVYFKTME